MECLHCKGTLVQRKISHAVTRRGYHLIIDDVPAWVCTQCGEPLFDEETVDIIQDMLEAIESRVRRFTPPLVGVA